MSDDRAEQRRFQFGTSALLLSMAFAAICLGSFMTLWNHMVEAQRDFLAPTVIWFTPFWLPFVFIAYAIGRKAVTGKFLIAFAIGQAIATGAHFLTPYLYR